MSSFISYDSDPRRAVLLAANVVSQNGVLIYPTRTVFGIGGDANSPEVAARVCNAKQSPPKKPVLVLTDEWSRVKNWFLAVSKQEQTLMRHPISAGLTLLLTASPQAPGHLLGESPYVGIRRTIHPFCRALIQASEVPLISTSANLSGAAPPARVDEIDVRLIKAVDLVVVSHHTEETIPSTVVRMGVDGPEIIRSGAVSEDEIQSILSL
jgi:tRNA threonylcarbamoyl adenosine modification protein (Sua5/YciO/YrdC/YwlC family)